MKEKKVKILSTKSAVIYGLGILGVQMFIGYMNSFQMEFYNKMYSAYDGNIFYIAAVIILIAKLISCIADPLIGAMIDHSHLKGGKIRPWILYSAVPIAVMTTVIFIYIPFKSKLALYSYITFTTVLWNVAMSFADIPSQGMLSLLSPVAEERNFAAGIANACKGVGSGGTGLIVTVVMLVLSAIYPDGYPDKLYYLITALILLVVGTTFYLLIYFFNRETVKSESSSTVSLKEMFTELKSNKMLLILFISTVLGFARTMTLGICVQTGGALVGKVYVPILSDLLAGGEALDPTSNATWLIGIFAAVMGMVCVVIIPGFNKKFGERKTMIILGVYGFIISAITYIIYIASPADASIRGGLPALIFTWITQGIIASSTCHLTLVPTIMTSDIVDYGEWKTGNRKEGIDFAVFSMAIKLSNAFATAAGIFIIGLSGYIDGCTVTPHMQNIVMFAYVAVPGISLLASAIPMFFYKIDGQTKVDMRKALENSRK